MQAHWEPAACDEGQGEKDDGEGQREPKRDRQRDANSADFSNLRPTLTAAVHRRHAHGSPGTVRHGWLKRTCRGVAPPRPATSASNS